MSDWEVVIEIEPLSEYPYKATVVEIDTGGTFRGTMRQRDFLTEKKALAWARYVKDEVEASIAYGRKKVKL